MAVPHLPATLTSVLAASGGASLMQVMSPALDLAKGNAPLRRATLEKIARRGSRAIVDDSIADELLAAGGRLAGGVLTMDDLENARPELASAHREAAGGRTPGHRSVIADRKGMSGERDASHVRIVTAVDGRGLVVVACYESYAEGVEIQGLELLAPPIAVPVMRGERRIPPATALIAAAPIAFSESEAFLDIVLGVAHAIDGESRLEELVTPLRIVRHLRRSRRTTRQRRASIVHC